jgi:ankyrin repeat protein
LALLCERIKRSKLSINSRDRNNKTALMSCRTQDGAQILLSFGADPFLCDNEGHDSIAIAAKNGNASLLETLIYRNRKSSLSNNKLPTFVCTKSAVIAAVTSGQLDCVRLLVESGFDINTQDSSKSTALMYAIKAKFIPCVELLLLNSPDVNLED